MQTVRRITRQGLKPLSLTLWQKQGCLCPLCGKYIDIQKKGEACVDHCHVTGRIRGVLHRSCNAGLGKVDKAVSSWIVKEMNYNYIIYALHRIIKYHENEKTHYIHPTYMTSEEMKAKRNKKARVRRAKIKATK
jgi:hypothetical protein